MAYATYKDYKALYGDAALDETGFTRLIWEAERAMDDATTGVDGVPKLRAAKPTRAYPLEAVRRCACALVDILRQIEAAEKAASAARGVMERADGTVTGRVVTNLSAGSESVSYAAPGSAQGVKTAVDAAVGDISARERLLAETVRRYLSGLTDANGVNLLYMGPYPAGR